MATVDLTANAVPSVIKSRNDAIDQLCVNTIRTLAMDAVQAANSGHPGTPMALAPVVYCLWQRVLRFDPSHNDLEMLERAFRTFKSTSDRPTLIIVDSHIAYGAPNKQDTSAARARAGFISSNAYELCHGSDPWTLSFATPRSASGKESRSTSRSRRTRSLRFSLRSPEKARCEIDAAGYKPN